MILAQLRRAKAYLVKIKALRARVDNDDFGNRSSGRVSNCKSFRDDLYGIKEVNGRCIAIAVVYTHLIGKKSKD